MKLARRHLRGSQLLRDERGVSVIEFAFLLPILGLLIVGVSDVSRAIATILRLEQAANRALEKATVGSVQSDYSYLKAEAAAGAGVPPEQVTVDNWLECDGEEAPDFNGSCEPDQQIARYVQITIDSSFTPSFSYTPFGPIFATGPDGSFAISADAALRVQ